MNIDDIEIARNDATHMESLYVAAVSADEESLFREAVGALSVRYKDNQLLLSWAYRLQVVALSKTSGGIDSRPRPRTYIWPTALGLSLLLSVAYVLLAGDIPAVPFPAELFELKSSNRLFVLAWAPITTLAIVLFLGLSDVRRDRSRYYGLAALGTGVMAGLIALTALGKPDKDLMLVALHQPFVYWALLALGVSFGHSKLGAQLYSFSIKSLEILLTAGLFLFAGASFVGLTNGIFLVLGLDFVTEANWAFIFNGGLGLVPVLAVATVYNPLVSPSEQNWSVGFTKVLRVLARMFLPLTFLVLAVYVLFLIPTNFWQAFNERNVLIVYNVTLFAIMLQLIFAVPGSNERLSTRQNQLLRYAVFAVALLAACLNAYSLAAVLSRTWNGGLTPNRLTIIGWNIVTLFSLVAVANKILATDASKWVAVFRSSISKFFLLPAIAWTFWVILGIASFFQ